MRVSFASLRKDSNVSPSIARSSVSFDGEDAVAAPEMGVEKTFSSNHSCSLIKSSNAASRMVKSVEICWICRESVRKVCTLSV